MIMKKVTCATCAGESKGKCTAKKGKPSVSFNKRRRCDKYVLEPMKVKERQLLKTVRIGHREKEALRKEYKEQLRQYRANAKQDQAPKNVSHPLTGDLSRFTSTAGDNSRGG